MNESNSQSGLHEREFREEAVKLALNEGAGVLDAARRLSVPLKTLANWGRSARAGKLQKVGRDQKPLTELEAELARVQRELAEVKMGRDLLRNISRGAPLPEGQKL
ncbi:transposase [Paraburkholderia tropica]|nr:transposase [Paraburkholderia tropica]MBB6323466.1 transposase [Paraburkholderia tropica]